MRVMANVWLGQEDSDEYWAEGAKAKVEVELTDADEVRIGVQLDGEDSDSATIYVSRESADKLARFLSAVAVDDLRISA